MDLKIRDVAELLNVSETTIRAWIADGKIPAYLLHKQHHFSRTEIEDWVMGLNAKTCKEYPGGSFHESPKDLEESLSSTSQSGGSKQFSLYRAINKGGVFYNVPGSNKEQLIHGLIKKIAGNLNIDADVVTELLLDREAMQSTGLNNGIAIPHTRDFLLGSHFDSVSVVFPEKPLMYDSLDGKPVDILFFLFACNDKRHLHLLAKIAHLSSHFEALQFLKSQPNKHALLDYVKTWESSIQQLQDVSKPA